jgi:UDP-N-acetylglucosamine:LPS N-acetylglucosamine transferase
MTGYRFIIPGPVPPHVQRVVSSGTLPFGFQTIMASCDMLITKPGYGTIVEAVASGTPVIYVRRYNFVDEDSLVRYLHRYGRGLELSVEDFLNGRWEQTMEAIMTIPASQATAPAATGAMEGADILKTYL